MGQASVAVFWEGNDWANPAVLGYQKGVTYRYGRTQLVPELADDVFFTTHQFAIGAYGVGISLAGRPFDDMEGLKLDYGTSEATDEEGNVIGTFRSYERVRQVGIGINVVETFESLVRAMGAVDDGLTRYVEVSLGHAWKEVLVDLAPGVTLDGQPRRGEVTEKDWGALARLTPIGARPGSPVRLDLSGGFSQRNYDDSRLSLGDVTASDPVVEERLIGGAGRLTFRLPTRSGGVWNFLRPEISLGGTFEQVRYYEGSTRFPGTIDRNGQELAFLGIFALRHGFVDDPAGGIEDQTWGWSAGLQYRGIIGARYDRAEVPQAEILDSTVEREGVTVFFDPFRWWRLSRGSDTEDGSSVGGW